jgi:ABC-type nickel/cobalt efflux system permease component RcnA
MSRRLPALTLGLLGGLLPSPSALFLLLAAVATGHVLVGVFAVVAFGLGMALALTGVGAAAAVGGRHLARLDGRPRWSRVAAATPWLAGAGIVGAGCLLVVRGYLLIGR